MRIFHIATASDWSAARRSGGYTTSTRGRTLEQEGFIHASRREQVGGVFAAFYADAQEPLVLLTIDTDRLDVPWRQDPVGEDTFPHLYGPLSPDAVVRVQQLDRHGGTGSFTGAFLGEIMVRTVLAIVAMVLAGVGSVLGGSLGGAWGPFLGAVVGLLVGVALFVVVVRRRG